jgi:hypothetical protein
MTVLLDYTDSIILIETYGMGPVWIAQDIIRRNADACRRRAVVGPQIDPSILMIVDERFTVQDRFPKIFIPVPSLAVDVTLLYAQGVSA